LANLTFEEMKMSSKWYGTKDLVSNQEFWSDCLKIYICADKVVPLPLINNEAERNRISQLVKCPPGTCGLCCRYDRIAISKEELSQLEVVTKQEIKTELDENRNMFLNSRGGCQFLKDNACIVYDSRPRVCKLFPIVAPRGSVTIDGAEFQQIQIRLKCSAALEVIKAVFVHACVKGKVMLLPDLSLIPVYDEGKGPLGVI
jgi:Fe-S-cluster containining protein